jgi:hypothetical protein
MHFFVRGVVYGFALSLGSALFKKVQDRLGLGEDKDKKSSEPAAVRDAASDPKLQS